MHKDNCFLTLTLNDEHVAKAGNSLERDRFPTFIRDLRNNHRGARIRYFHCGEYGSLGDRPHYHAAVFGYGFPDRKKWADRAGNPTYRSDELEELWPDGHAEIGSVTFKSAAYIARYVTKKIKLTEHSSEEAIEEYYARYERVNALTGEIQEVEPEFATMSLRPGIGEGWLRKFWKDVYPSDSIVVNGKTQRPPRYYDRLLAKWCEAEATLRDVSASEAQLERAKKARPPKGITPDLWDKVRRTRARNQDRENQTAERLLVQEKCKTAEINLFARRS